MKDFLGNALAVGDEVVFPISFRSGRIDICKGSVSRFTPKRVEVAVTSEDFKGRGFLVDPHNVTLISRPECTDSCVHVGYCEECNRNGCYQDQYESMENVGK